MAVNMVSNTFNPLTKVKDLISLAPLL